jgi:GH24 family phage-related lysozyme (muramidase)
MANYNANAMAAYKQYGQSMIAGGGGSNMSGTGSSTMQVFNAMRDDDDKPSGLAAKPTTTKDKKPSFWDRITSVFQQNEVDVTNVYKPSVDPSKVYTQKMFEMVPSASDYVYRAEMSDQTQDMVEQAMGYEVPKLGQLQMIGEGPMTAEEQKQFGPLMKMADDIRNPNITTEELPDVVLDQDAAVTDALMQGQPSGLMSRPSSFTGNDVQVATNTANMSPEQLEQYYTDIAASLSTPSAPENIDMDFLGAREGFKLDAYVPENKDGTVIENSGVTIGTGVDLGSKNAAYFEGLDPNIEGLLSPYYGKKKKAAQDALVEFGGFTLTEKQAKELDAFVKAKELNALKDRWNKTSDTDWDDLTTEQATTVASVAYQYGNLATETPKFWKQVTSGDWQKAYENLMNFGDKYGPRREVEAELLRSGMRNTSPRPMLRP